MIFVTYKHKQIHSFVSAFLVFGQEMHSLFVCMIFDKI